jgi:hypothetical protein
MDIDPVNLHEKSEWLRMCYKGNSDYSSGKERLPL